MAAQKLEINSKGMIFTGLSVRVEVAFLTARNANGLNDALVKLTGPRAEMAGLNGKLLRCEGLPTGRELALAHRKRGQSYNLIRSSDNWKTAELYINNQTMKIKLDENLSKDAQPFQLLAEYDQRFDAIPGREPIEAKLSNLKQNVVGFPWQGSFEIDWNGKMENREAHQAVNATIDSLPLVMQKLMTDDHKREAFRSIPALSIKVVGGFNIIAMKNGSALSIHVGESYSADEINEALTKLLEQQL